MWSFQVAPAMQWICVADRSEVSSVEVVLHTSDPELLMSAVAMLAQPSVFEDGGVTKKQN